MNASHDYQDQDLAGMLADLPVPDHGDTFWSELEAGLAEGADGAPGTVVAHVPKRGTSRRYVAAGLAAAAVLLIGLFAAGALRSTGTDLDTDLDTDLATDLATDIADAPDGGETTVRPSADIDPDLSLIHI